MGKLNWERVRKENQMRRSGVERVPTEEDISRFEAKRGARELSKATTQRREALPRASEKRSVVRYISARIVSRPGNTNARTSR